MRPKKDTFDSYFHGYVDLVPSENHLDELKLGFERIKFLSDIPESMKNYSYDHGKWTINELLQHIIDTELVFNYRALRFSRADQTSLPGYDHEAYAINTNANEKELKDLVELFMVQRAFTLQLFKGFDSKVLNYSGEANGKQLTVLSIAYLLVGHEIHHLSILKEKYLKL
ncbi:MAG: DinB family protein [Flavobacteriales bacterium]|nr:DinB family protein [Flavobacteriales bacterium]